MPMTPKPKIDAINWTALATGGTFLAGAAAAPGMPVWLSLILGIIGYGLTAIGGTIRDDYELPKSGKDARDRYLRRYTPSAIVLALVGASCALLLGCGGWQLSSVTHEASGASVVVEGQEVTVDAISALRVCVSRGQLEHCEEVRPSVYWQRSEGVIYLCASHRMIPAEAACVPIPVREGEGGEK